MRRHLPVSFIPPHFISGAETSLKRSMCLENWRLPAEKLIDPVGLDAQVLKHYQAHPDLIDALDSWILAPDRKLLLSLSKLADVVHRVQPNYVVGTCYRGFHLTGDYQENLDLVTKGTFFNKTKKFVVGDEFHYQSTNKVLSFTSDIDIARAFGKVIVSVSMKNYRGGMLVVTDELSYLVSQKRNIQPVSQKEIIFLPPYSFDFVIAEINK